MGKINILFVTSAKRIGGAEQTLLFILKNLNQDLFSPSILIPEEGLLFDELKKMKVKIIKSKSVKKLNLFKMTFRIGNFKFYNPLTIIINAIVIGFYFFSSITAIYLILRRLKVDILHVNSEDIAVRALLAAKSMRKPTIFFVFGILKSNIETLALRKLINAPFKTVCASNAIRRSILSDVKNIDKVKTIYLGIDLHLFNEQIDIVQSKQLSESLKLGNLVIGIAGRFDPLKGHETFLEAASKVADNVNDISFLIVGSWVLDFEKPRVNFLKQYAEKLGLKEKVIFTDFTADVRKYYHLMDIVVVPSWEEPLGLVTLEAMACGKPVIGTNSGGTPEIIQDQVSGILVPPRDPVALARAIIRLSEDGELRKRLSSEGRKIIEEFFNGSRFINDIESIYKEAISPT